jgi:hypothetical protein
MHRLAAFSFVNQASAAKSIGWRRCMPRANGVEHIAEFD